MDKPIKLYARNRGNAPIHHGRDIIIPAHTYTVFSAETCEQLRNCGLPLQFEGDSDFAPLWIRNVPDKTPNQVR